MLTPASRRGLAEEITSWPDLSARKASSVMVLSYLQKILSVRSLEAGVSKEWDLILFSVSAFSKIGWFSKGKLDRMFGPSSALMMLTI
jgi:hypothetical protein